MSRALALLLVFATPTAERAPRIVDDAHVSLTVFESDGQAMCSVRTENAPLERVLAALVERGQVHVDGLDPEWQRMRVTADLRDRPLSQALAYVLGSVGLRAELRGDVLTVRSDVEATRDADDARAAALASYMRVLRDFPEHALAPEAELRQAEIEESRGNTIAARTHFEAVANNYPDSPRAVEALLLAGEASMRERDWSAASTSLLTLLRKSAPIELQARGRLALARCFAMQGQHERALYALDALDALQAPESPTDRDARRRIRVRALSGLSRGREALDLLSELEQGQASEREHTELLELRALACESAHLPAESARAWLAFARRCEPGDRERALCSSAEHALEAGDELGVLFIARMATAEMIESPKLSHCEQAARRALALTTGAAHASSSEEQLLAAEHSLESEDWRGAIAITRTLQASRAKLAPAVKARLDSIYVRALAEYAGVEEAVDHVRACLTDERDADTRRNLYLLAAEAFEREDRLDDAIDAYQGRL